MQVISDHSAAGLALATYVADHAGTLPEFTRQKVLESFGSPSPVDRYVGVTEAIYAAKGDVGKDARDLAIAISRFAASEGFHDPDRRRAIADTFCRIGGYSAPEGREWHPADDDPAPREQFVEAVEPPAEPLA